jgi:diguanylate cyclase (GGDEF)-like protein
MVRAIPQPPRAAAVLPWAAIACLGIISVGRPVGRHGGLELALGGGITFVLIAVMLWAPRPRSSTLALVVPALAYLFAVVLLRDATGGSRGGMNSLVLLPAFAVALHGSRGQLLCVIGGLMLVFLGPLVAIGGAAYPDTGVRSALLLGSIAAIVGFSIHGLVTSLREREREREELLARLAEQASTDELTGLANLRSWNSSLGTSLARATRTGEPLSIALLDLDHFKAINDTRGHAAGDALLRLLAGTLESELRPGDVLARIGGDEFGLLLPGCTLEAAVAIVERLAVAVPAGHTFSAGVATWGGVEPIERLTERTDVALYAAKSGGRNRVCAAAEDEPAVICAQSSAAFGRSGTG